MVAVARIMEISAAPDTDLDEAVATGIANACAGLGPVRYARVNEKHVDVGDANKVRLKVSFVLED